MSRTNAHAVAVVWNRPLPMPTETESQIRIWPPAGGRSERLARSQAAHAAIRKDALVIAFSGSASRPGAVRSQ